MRPRSQRRLTEKPAEDADARRCTVATYPDRAGAIAAKRRVLSEFCVHVAVMYCEICDSFHLEQRGRSPFMPHWIEILKYVAQGYHDNEIGPLVGLTPRTVERNVGVMMRRFYALSRTHLIAISISLGLVHPNDFVPAERERFHA